MPFDDRFANLRIGHSLLMIWVSEVEMIGL